MTLVINYNLSPSEQHIYLALYCSSNSLALAISGASFLAYASAFFVAYSSLNAVHASILASSASVVSCWLMKVNSSASTGVNVLLGGHQWPEK